MWNVGFDFWTVKVLCMISCARIERVRETVMRFKEREKGACFVRDVLVFLYEMDLMEYYKTLWVLWNNTLK